MPFIKKKRIENSIKRLASTLHTIYRHSSIINNRLNEHINKINELENGLKKAESNINKIEQEIRPGEREETIPTPSPYFRRFFISYVLFFLLLPLLFHTTGNNLLLTFMGVLSICTLFTTGGNFYQFPLNTIWISLFYITSKTIYQWISRVITETVFIRHFLNNTPVSSAPSKIFNIFVIELITTTFALQMLFMLAIFILILSKELINNYAESKANLEALGINNSTPHERFFSYLIDSRFLSICKYIKIYNHKILTDIADFFLAFNTIMEITINGDRLTKLASYLHHLMNVSDKQKTIEYLICSKEVAENTPCNTLISHISNTENSLFFPILAIWIVLKLYNYIYYSDNEERKLNH